MSQAIHNESADYLLNVNEEEYIQHLLSRFLIDPLDIDLDNMYLSNREEQIPAAQHPRSAFIVEAGRSYTRQVITYHIPYKGTEDLITSLPNPRLNCTHPVY